MKLSQISAIVALFAASQVHSAAFPLSARSPIVLTPEMQAQGIHQVKTFPGFFVLRDEGLSTSEDLEVRKLPLDKREPFVVTEEMLTHGFKYLRLPAGGAVALRNVETDKRAMPLEVTIEERAPESRRSEHSIPLGNSKLKHTSRGMPVAVDFEERFNSGPLDSRSSGGGKAQGVRYLHPLN